MRNFLSILRDFAGSARNLISSQSSLLDHCEKTQSFFPDDSNNDMPESGFGSHVKPILEHLYHENPKNLNAKRSAFGDGGGGIAKINIMH